MWPVDRWSLAGAQAKIAAIQTPTGWEKSTGQPPSTHIIKPGVPRFADQALNEHVVMSAAARVGHITAETQMQVFDGVDAIVVTRYDRYAPRPGVIPLRVHQEDICQELAVMPDRKYPGDGGPTASQIAEILNPTDRRRFASAVVFQALIGAPEGHSRNYSILIDEKQARLAPLYDVASTLPYVGDLSPTSELMRTATGIGGRNRFGEIEDRHVERFATTVGVDPGWLVDDAHRQAEALPDALADAGRATSHRRATRMSEALIVGVRDLSTAKLGPTGRRVGSQPTDRGQPDDEEWTQVLVRAHLRDGKPVAEHYRWRGRRR